MLRNINKKLKVVSPSILVKVWYTNFFGSLFIKYEIKRRKKKLLNFIIEKKKNLYHLKIPRPMADLYVMLPRPMAYLYVMLIL